MNNKNFESNRSLNLNDSYFQHQLQNLQIQSNSAPEVQQIYEFFQHMIEYYSNYVKQLETQIETMNLNNQKFQQALIAKEQENILLQERNKHLELSNNQEIFKQEITSLKYQIQQVNYEMFIKDKMLKNMQDDYSQQRQTINLLNMQLNSYQQFNQTFQNSLFKNNELQKQENYNPHIYNQNDLSLKKDFSQNQGQLHDNHINFLQNDHSQIIQSIKNPIFQDQEKINQQISTQQIASDPLQINQKNKSSSLPVTNQLSNKKKQEPEEKLPNSSISDHQRKSQFIENQQQNQQNKKNNLESHSIKNLLSWNEEEKPQIKNNSPLLKVVHKIDSQYIQAHRSSESSMENQQTNLNIQSQIQQADQFQKAFVQNNNQTQPYNSNQRYLQEQISDLEEQKQILQKKLNGSKNEQQNYDLQIKLTDIEQQIEFMKLL